MPDDPYDIDNQWSNTGSSGTGIISGSSVVSPPKSPSSLTQMGNMAMNLGLSAASVWGGGIGMADGVKTLIEMADQIKPAFDSKRQDVASQYRSVTGWKDIMARSGVAMAQNMLAGTPVGKALGLTFGMLPSDGWKKLINGVYEKIFPKVAGDFRSMKDHYKELVKNIKVLISGPFSKPSGAALLALFNPKAAFGMFVSNAVLGAVRQAIGGKFDLQGLLGSILKDLDPTGGFLSMGLAGAFGDLSALGSLGAIGSALGSIGSLVGGQIGGILGMAGAGTNLFTSLMENPSGFLDGLTSLGMNAATSYLMNSVSSALGGYGGMASGIMNILASTLSFSGVSGSAISSYLTGNMINMFLGPALASTGMSGMAAEVIAGAFGGLTQEWLSNPNFSVAAGLASAMGGSALAALDHLMGALGATGFSPGWGGVVNGTGNLTEKIKKMKESNMSYAPSLEQSFSNQLKDSVKKAGQNNNIDIFQGAGSEEFWPPASYGSNMLEVMNPGGAIPTINSGSQEFSAFFEDFKAKANSNSGEGTSEELKAWAKKLAGAPSDSSSTGSTSSTYPYQEGTAPTAFQVAKAVATYQTYNRVLDVMWGTDDTISNPDFDYAVGMKLTEKSLGYTHEQTEPAQRWFIPSYKSRLTEANFVLNIFDEKGLMVQADDVICDSNSNITILFDRALAGKAVISKPVGSNPILKPISLHTLDTMEGLERRAKEYAERVSKENTTDKKIKKGSIKKGVDVSKVDLRDEATRKTVLAGLTPSTSDEMDPDSIYDDSQFLDHDSVPPEIVVVGDEYANVVDDNREDTNRTPGDY